MNLPNPSSKNSHPAYRADIDGLRALAILPVVMFHAFPDYMRSGFVGVDIFFVISGYLISVIILGALQSGHFSFLDFYARRAKRLFPALLLVLGSTYLFAWLSLFPHEYQQFGKHLAAGAGYAENLVLLQEAGYFDLQSQLKPLMHLWSLSVEEQFYLAYPVLVWMAWAVFKNRVLWVILAMAVLSFALNISEIHANADVAYFAPQTRFWELLAGALLAWYHVAKPLFVARWPRALLVNNGWVASGASVLGFVLVFLSVFAFTRNELYPGWWALIPVTGAFLLIFSGPKALVNRTLLSSRVLVAIGLISYPLYLWHWSLLSFGRIIANETPAPAIQGALVLASFVLAWATYRFLETPFKSWVSNDRRKVSVLCGLSIVCVAMGLLTSGGYLPWQTQSAPLIAKLESAKKDWKFPPARFVPVQSERIYALTHASPATEKKVLFIGDSNLEQYGVRIEEKLTQSPTTTAGVILVPIQKNCDIVNAVISEQGCATQLNALHELADDANVTRVVLVVAWLKYEKYLVDPANRTRLANFLSALSKGKSLVIFRNIPADPGNLSPDAQVSRGLSLRGGTMALHPRVSTVDSYNQRFKDIDAELRQIAQMTGAALVSPVDHLCASGTCPAVDSEENFLYIDAGHLTASYARKAAVYIDPLLEL